MIVFIFLLVTHVLSVSSHGRSTNCRVTKNRKPVCGYNGKTFFNRNAARCALQVIISIRLHIIIYFFIKFCYRKWLVEGDALVRVQKRNLYRVVLSIDQENHAELPWKEIQFVDTTEKHTLTPARLSVTNKFVIQIDF